MAIKEQTQDPKLPSVPDVYRAINDVTKAMSKEGIAKNRKNTQGAGYNFRGIDDVYNALSGVIADAGLCILPRMTERLHEERTSKQGGALFYVTVRAEFDFVSERDGSKHTVATYGEAMDSSDKATNKAMSAAFKYACFQTFVIPTESMDDADAHTPEPAPRQQRPKPAPQQDGNMLPPEGKLISVEEFRTSNRTVKLDAFERIRGVIGDEQYFRILGVLGVEQATQFGTLGEAVKAYSEMLETHHFQTASRPVA